MDFVTVPIKTRIQQLRHLRQRDIIRTLRTEGYTESRGTIRRLLGVATEQRELRTQPGTPCAAVDSGASGDVSGLSGDVLSDDTLRAWVDAWRGILPTSTGPTIQPASNTPQQPPCPAPLDIVGPQPEPLRLDNWLYCADNHTPFHNALMHERLCAVGRKHRIRTLVIGGDFFDLDSFSRHGDDIAQSDPNRAIAVAGAVLNYLADTFDTIYMLPGNHCRRLARRINKNLSFRNLVLMSIGEYDIASRIKTTEDDFLVIGDSDVGQDPDQIGYTVGHPAFYSQYATNGYEKLALLHRRHVVGSHRHVLGVTRYHNRYMLIDPGQMCRTDLTPYLRRSHKISRHADQSSGFVAIQRNRPRIFADGFTDWRDYQ